MPHGVLCPWPIFHTSVTKTQNGNSGAPVMVPITIRPKKKNNGVYCHMLKKIRVGRSEIYIFLILFFISELILDGFWNAFLHFNSDI